MDYTESLQPTTSELKQHSKKYSLNKKKQQQYFDLNWLGLHPFQSIKPLHIYAIHHLTSIESITFLLEQVRTTTTCSIHTEKYYKSRKDNLIKIELIQLEKSISYVLLFQINNLPTINGELFYMIQALLKTLFLPTKKFYTWNVSTKDLNPFVRTRYLTRKILKNLNLISLQKPFKQWYNRTYKHGENCCVSSLDSEDDASYCVCPYRPYKLVDHQWALYKAIAYVFDESICTSNRTSKTLPNDFIDSASDCLAITKLAMVIELNWTKEQVYQYKKFHQGKSVYE